MQTIGSVNSMVFNSTDLSIHRMLSFAITYINAIQLVVFADIGTMIDWSSNRSDTKMARALMEFMIAFSNMMKNLSYSIHIYWYNMKSKAMQKVISLGYKIDKRIMK